MTAIVYPPALPGPISAPLQSAERRLLSTLPGPRQSRALQRDRLATQQVDFIFTNAQAAIFAAWVKDDLLAGGAWFSANWPQPHGGAGIRRFVSAPFYSQYLPTFGWRVSAVCELRGRSQLPTGLGAVCVGGWRESFNGGLSDYSFVGGDINVFRFNPNGTYGPSLSIPGGGITAFSSSIYRPVNIINFTSINFKVRLDAIKNVGLPDDAALLNIRMGALSQIVFNPAREKFFDGTQAAYISIGGGSGQAVSPGQLQIAVWYDATLHIQSPFECIFTLKLAATGVVIQTTSIAGSFLPWSADQILFSDSLSQAGGSDSKPGCTYDEIEFC